MYQPDKKTPAVIEFVDIAGLVKGASQGAGLGNKFLENIRRTDAIVHVVRCFDDENIMHVVADAGTNVPVDPLGDIETIDLELIMADLDMVNRRVEKAAKAAKGDKKFLHEAEVFRALAEHLNAGRSARTFDCGDEDRAIVETADLLSLKPIIYAANMDEAGFADHENNRYFQMVRDLAQKEGAQVLPICAKLEEDIAQLDDPDERAMFLEDLGVEQSGLDRLIQCSYELLGLIRLLGQEASAWDGEQLRAWLLRCTVNRCHDLHRFRLRRPVLALADLPETAAEADSGAAELWDAVAHLPEKAARPHPPVLCRGIFHGGDRRAAGHSGGHSPHPAPPGPKKTQRPAGRRRP